jgi:AAA domain-containing protein
VIVADLPLPAWKIANLFGLAAASYRDGATRNHVVRLLTTRLALDEPTLGDIEAGDIAELLADHPSSRNGHRVVPDEDNEPLEIEKSEDPDALPHPTLLGNVKPEPITYLVPDLLIRDDLNGTGGEGGSGKSTYGYAVTGAIAAGALVLGLHRPPDPDGARVLIASAEDSKAVIQNRIYALGVGHGWDRARLDQNIAVYDPSDGVDLLDPRWVARLIEECRDTRAVLGYLDPALDLCAGKINENSNSEVARVTAVLRQIMTAGRTTVWLAMHATKPGAEEADRKYRFRGAGAWLYAMRKAWWVEGQDGGMELEDVKRNRSRASAKLRLRLKVTEEPDNTLMWQSATLSPQGADQVVGPDVLAILRYVKACRERPSGREITHARRSHGVPESRAEEALAACRTQGWMAFELGPKRAQLWALTAAGEARWLFGASE